MKIIYKIRSHSKPMKRIDKIFRKILTLTFFYFFVSQSILACSGYKITIGNRTIFGSNHDAWFTTPHIWFETATIDNYGAAFTGARFDGENGYAPQSGMNEFGLVFERLSSYHPPQTVDYSERKTITNPTMYLKDILHSCKTVEEVKEYISKYDHSFFIEDIFIYADTTGKYLIVEPYTLIIGNELSYVFSNFCPSITSKQDARNLVRYRNGVEFLKTKIDTTLEFCTQLSDTMHVCREKIGDGTLITSIWDLNNRTVNLFFYHQYKKSVQFNITEELKKGDHSINITTLFPQNSEFEKLLNYKTPKNSIAIGIFIVTSAGLFIFTALFFLFKLFRRQLKEVKYKNIHIILIPLSLILSYYMYVLSGSVNVFYFSAPYKDTSNVFVSLTSYIPFLLLLIIIPFFAANFRILKEKNWGIISKGIFTLNNIVYLVLIGLFCYWKFYDVL